MRGARLTILGLVLAMLALAGARTSAQWRTDDASVPRTTIAELQKLMAQADVLVVDVRDVRDFQIGHIPGSVSIPLGTEALRVEQLRKVTKQIVTYCT